VVWSSAGGGEDPTLFDGGVEINGPWAQAEGGLWSAPLPASLAGVPVRNLFAGRARLVRTRTNAAALGLLPAQRTELGIETASAAPLDWADPASVELVSDHTWVQHRCPVTAVAALPVPPPPPPAPPAPEADCKWTAAVPGQSPGSSLNQTAASSLGDCQQRCCEALPGCKAIIFARTTCFLLDRKYEGNFVPLPATDHKFVADLNCSGGAAPTCGPPPPPPVLRSKITISAPCWETASKPGALSATVPTIAWFENTGQFSKNGSSVGGGGGSREFYIDRIKKRVLISGGAAPTAVVAAVTEQLMTASGAHDIEWHNLTFTHAGWPMPSLQGIVERYGGTLFQLDPESGAGEQLMASAAAVDVGSSHRVRFSGCVFESLGAWGLRLRNGTQDATVSYCNFTDLSGGGICIGDWHDMQRPPSQQLARVTVEDNTLVGLGVEFGGAPGIHSYCMRQSSISHNKIEEVAYSGISYNWPSPQGPTFGGAGGLGGPELGYSADNRIEYNDVSRYMNYMLDGGGIHTIGRSVNTSVSSNYFHDVASGQQCGAGPCHSVVSQSSICKT
jgi:hypothetical protein